MKQVEPEHALAIVLLLRDERDVRYESAAVRWLGQWLALHPGVGLSHAADLIDSFADLSGASPDVARARAAVLLDPWGAMGPPACSSGGEATRVNQASPAASGPRAR